MRLTIVIMLFFAIFLVAEAIHPYPLIKGKAVGVVGAKKLHLVQKAALAKLVGAKKVGVAKKILLAKKLKAIKAKKIAAAKLKKKALIKKPLIFYG